MSSLFSISSLYKQLVVGEMMNDDIRVSLFISKTIIQVVKTIKAQQTESVHKEMKIIRSGCICSNNITRHINMSNEMEI